ncbi:MAG: hypothetical protein HRU19_22335 [Pseudobacteriovorax sp.]|nr:hypothetical protein [Pseudobacteriovorax sp.]
MKGRNPVSFHLQSPEEILAVCRSIIRVSSSTLEASSKTLTSAQEKLEYSQRILASHGITEGVSQDCE